MNISVRVENARALAQLRQLQAEMARTRVAAGGASAGAGGIGNNEHLNNLRRFGNQLQWTGRQLELNFSLPILAAAGAATKFALDNEKAMTRIQKVYGDGSMSVQQMKNETEALGRSMVALSNLFGIAQADALNIAADWAQAGSSGLSLAKSVELTMRTMVLGELDATEATKALISIQAQYGLSTDELSKTIDTLNMVENQTGISMQGLIQGFERSAGTARAAGVDIEHLAALLAAMTPAAGSAAQAGNALKTILSRIMSPTNDAVEVMAKFGVNVESASWQSKNGAVRLEALAQAFKGLTGGQKIVAAAVLGSRWQINRLGVALNDIGNYLDVVNGKMTKSAAGTSYYGVALESTRSASRNFAQAQRELTAVLESNPQRLQIIWTQLQNAMADVIVPILPTIIALANSVAIMAQKFADLDPMIHSVVISLLLLFAAIGPLVRVGGAFVSLFTGFRAVFGWLGTAFAPVLNGFASFIGLFITGGARIASAWGVIVGLFRYGVTAIVFLLTGGGGAIGRALFIIRNMLVTFGPMVIAALTSPWGIAIAAVIAIINIFPNQIENIWNDIVASFAVHGAGIMQMLQPVIDFFGGMVQSVGNAFWSLPDSVTGALVTVVNVVRNAALQVYDWFSYLNPWARHSPSLVESTETGMNAVSKAYGKAAKIGAVYSTATRQLEAFKRIQSRLGGGAFDDNRADVAKADPSALASFDALVRTYNRLNAVVDLYNARIARQQAVVDGWKVRLDSANRSLDAQQKLLDTLQNRLSTTQARMEGYQSKIDNFASTPIKGMRAYSDAIFKNEQAQKRLQLEMLKMGDSNSVEKIKDQYSKLGGDIEQMMGRIGALRSKGAGSDVLGPLQAELKKMQAAQGALGKKSANNPIAKMTAELEKLQQQAQRLDLEQSLKFDPLTRQVDQLANGMKELPFSQIIAGIKTNKANIAALQPVIDAQTRAVDAQQRVVDRLTASRDRLQDRYDAESDKLSALTDEMQKYKDMASDVSSALSQVGGAAAARNQEAEARKRAREAAAKKKKADKEKKEKKPKALKPPKESPAAKAFDAAAKAGFPEVGGRGTIGREGGAGDQSKLIDAYTKGLNDRIKNAMEKINPLNLLKAKWQDVKNWWNTNAGVMDLKGFFGDVNATLYENVTQPLQRGWGAVVSWWKGLNLGLLFGDVSESFEDIRTAVGDALAMVTPELQKLWAVLGPFIVVAFKRFAQEALTVAKVLGGLFLGALKLVWNILAKVLPPTIRLIGALFADIIRIITGVVKVISGIMTGDLKKALSGVGDIFMGLFSGIGHIVTGGVKIVLAIVWGFVDGIVDWLIWLWDKAVGHSIIPDMVKAIIAWFVNLYTNGIAKIKKFVTDVVGWIKSLPGKAWEALSKLSGYVASRSDAAWYSFRVKASGQWSKFWTWIKARPGAAYDALVNLKAKLSARADAGFYGFRVKATEQWAKFWTWIKARPGAAYDGLVNLKSKLSARADAAFYGFRVKASEQWGKFYTWIKERPGKAYDGIKAIADKLKTAGENALKGLRTGASTIWNGKSGVLQWFKDLPGKIATAMSGIGGKVTGAIKSAWNSAVGWLNKNGLANVNKVTEKFGLHINSLPKFERGGVVPGGYSRKDNQLIAARSGEGVLVPEAVRAIGGPTAIEDLNKRYRTSRVAAGLNGYPGFANGGIVGRIVDYSTDKVRSISGSIGGWLEKGAGYALSKIISPLPGLLRSAMAGSGLVENVVAGSMSQLKDKAKQWGDKNDFSAAGGGSFGRGGHWPGAVMGRLSANTAAAVNFVRKTFGINNIGTVGSRPNKSDHPMGKALDAMLPNWSSASGKRKGAQIAGWFVKNASRFGTKYVIYYDRINSGSGWRRYTHPLGPNNNPTLQHRDHVHVSFLKNGGRVKSSRGGTPVVLGEAGRDETVVDHGLMNRRMKDLESVRNLMAPTGVQRLSIQRAVIRVDHLSADNGSTVRRGDGEGKVEYHFHGNLEFPNVKTAADADGFIRNLKTVSGRG